MRNFHPTLREQTRSAHDLVDNLFGHFDLVSARSYAAMLRAHAAALFPIEAWLSSAGQVPGWSPRGTLLADDLADLSSPSPDAEPVDWRSDEASLWGAAYVLEGSRLGGAMLARSLGKGLPSRYLGDAHPPGHWRQFLSVLDVQATHGGENWRELAIASAQRVFGTFAQAARCEGAQ